MKKVAIDKASGHLAKARLAVSAMEKATTFERFEDAWGGFLTEYGRFFSKLETGAKRNAKSQQWFGGIKRQRKDDPLMSYLFQARNSAEHGLGEVTRRAADAGRIRFPATNEIRAAWQMRINSDGTFDIKDPKVTTGEGEFTNLELWNARVELVTVTDDRFAKESWVPPEMHRERPIVDRSPAGLAKLALAYLEIILADAAKLPQ